MFNYYKRVLVTPASRHSWKLFRYKTTIGKHRGSKQQTKIVLGVNAKWPLRKTIAGVKYLLEKNAEVKRPTENIMAVNRPSKKTAVAKRLSENIVAVKLPL